MRIFLVKNDRNRMSTAEDAFEQLGDKRSIK